MLHQKILVRLDVYKTLDTYNEGEQKVNHKPKNQKRWKNETEQ